jgi:hypothetical protein
LDKRRSKAHRHVCANPVCAQPLDWAAPIYPKKGTPKDRIHQVAARTAHGQYFMCYACGHYTELRPFPIKTTTMGTHVEVIAETDVVNSIFLHYLLDDMEEAHIRPSGQYLKLVLEIIASEIDITLMQALDVFRRAIRMGLRGSQVAYVISGRPLSATAKMVESIARNRGIHLRFFMDRQSALSWLKASDEAGRIA